MQQYDFDVVLSFAGEDRSYAEKLANLLKYNKYLVFYDQFESAQLWGKDLYAHFSSIYKDQARYCVMFLSEHYARKLWSNHERQSAQARAFKENTEYILPVRLDDTEIPGVLSTVGYLDLREMEIEEVYQALVEKLSETTSRRTTTDTLTSAKVEIDSGEFVLLCPKDGGQYFIPIQSASWAPTEIFLELLPESGEQTAFLRSLRIDNINRFARPNFAFALEEDAAWVSPQEVTQTTSGSQTIWKVVLKEDSGMQNYGLSKEIGFSCISPDEIAEIRAKRILLNEKPETTNPYTVNVYNQLLENQILGRTSSQYENILQVSESPIPNLYRSYGKEPERFQKFVRLVSVLYLKLSNTCEDILKLDFKLLKSKKLRVKFEGKRRQQYSFYSNVEPSIIQVDGICRLSE